MKGTNMKNKRPIHAPRIAIGDKPNCFIEVWVSYDDGKGPGYDDGKTHVRGYKLHAQPIEESPSGTTGYFVKKMIAYSGIFGFMEPATRYSEKRHRELATGAATTELYKRLIENVAAKNDFNITN